METVELIKAVGLAVAVVIIAGVGRRMQVVQPSPDAKANRAAEEAGPVRDDRPPGTSTTGTSFAGASGGVAGQPSARMSRSRSRRGRRRSPANQTGLP